MSSPEQAYGAGTRPFTAGGQTAASSTTTAERPAVTTGAARPVPRGPRKVRLTLAKVDPWSVMKLGFLLSVAIGIAFVVLVAVLWTILDSMGVFADIDRTVGTVLGSSSGTQFDLMDYVGFGRVISLATVIAVIDVFLLTALATLGSFLYNVCSQLVGGVQMTLTDD
ncbi:DUF3566 domain-containing protein [Angustibacter sp. McL0619]|uniref:DUF3566 domain-containing protein n=1 Tax=Angustibacter sp. McL0619 TaxID=3415676 RepID=UPI003CF71F48